MKRNVYISHSVIIINLTLILVLLHSYSFFIRAYVNTELMLQILYH